MSQAEDFDAFYTATWQPLLLQTFAACGDLAIARESVHHAFVDAWHHWQRAQWQGADGYVRTAAFARAALRTRTRAFHRSQRVTRDQRATLKALGDLGLQARRALVLACLSDLALPAISKQIGETEGHASVLIAHGASSVATSLAVSEDQVAGRLRALAGAARAAAQATPAELRSQGVRRRRVWLAGGVAAAIVLTVLAGAVVRLKPVAGLEQGVSPRLASQVSTGLLLDSSGLAPIGSSTSWTVQQTGDNTAGTGINTFCQRSRFADPHGLQTYVRSFGLDGTSTRKATQTIELSQTDKESRTAYRTVLAWFSGCKAGSLQLVSSYNVTGLGDDAMVLKLRGAGRNLDGYAVAVARTGHLLTWTTVVSSGARSPDTSQLVSALGNAVRRVCTSKAAGSCTSRPVVKQNPPPPSGEQAGMLTVADLPSVRTISRPWVGTSARKSPDNPAATTCDNADFLRAGASPALTRTFLVPGGGAPTRFGISETLGQFATPAKAKGLMSRIVDRMNHCEKRDLGANVTASVRQMKGPRGSSFYLWRLKSEISKKRTVVFWMGVAQFGRNTAQVSFVPGDGKQDVSKPTFRKLVQRTRDRLYELPRASGVS